MNDERHIMFIFNDITRIKDLEKEMSELRTLYFSFKAIINIFSQITHELRTPLISMLTLLDRLKGYVESERG